MASSKDKSSSRSEASHSERTGDRAHHSDKSDHQKSSHRSEHENRQRSDEKDHEKRASNERDNGRAEVHEKSNRSSGSKTKMPNLEPGKSMRTTDHAVIQQWVEDRGGSPATVKATESGEDPGLLRINFPGYSGKYSLEDISWEDFFQKFDEKHLEFLFQDQTKGGKQSRFFKFVNPSGSRGRSGSKSGDSEGGSSGGSRSKSAESRSRNKSSDSHAESKDHKSNSRKSERESSGERKK